jgi:transcription elongation factor S-II
MPSRWKEYEDRVSAEVRVITQGELVATTTLFKCSKCKNNICSYYQLQTRSMDEGVTNYITCNTCGHKWKQNN